MKCGNSKMSMKHLRFCFIACFVVYFVIFIILFMNDHNPTPSSANILASIKSVNKSVLLDHSEYKHENILKCYRERFLRFGFFYGNRINNEFISFDADHLKKLQDKVLFVMNGNCKRKTLFSKINCDIPTLNTVTCEKYIIIDGIKYNRSYCYGELSPLCQGMDIIFYLDWIYTNLKRYQYIVTLEDDILLCPGYFNLLYNVLIANPLDNLNFMFLAQGTTSWLIKFDYIEKFKDLLLNKNSPYNMKQGWNYQYFVKHFQKSGLGIDEFIFNHHVGSDITGIYAVRRGMTYHDVDMNSTQNHSITVTYHCFSFIHPIERRIIGKKTYNIDPRDHIDYDHIILASGFVPDHQIINTDEVTNNKSDFKECFNIENINTELQQNTEYNTNYDGIIGFVFVIGNRFNNIEIWNKYFSLLDKNKYKVFIHSKAAYKLKAFGTLNNLTFDYIVVRTRRTWWGNILYAIQEVCIQALKIKELKGIITLSGDTIPIKNPNYAYHRIINENKDNLSILFFWNSKKASTWMYLNREFMEKYSIPTNYDEFHIYWNNTILKNGAFGCKDEIYPAWIVSKYRTLMIKHDLITWNCWIPIKASIYIDIFNASFNKIDTNLHPLTIKHSNKEMIHNLFHLPNTLFARKFIQYPMLTKTVIELLG